ncbi:MAG: bifunctional metallophosphatase/5'-nucleotidase [Lachnospiraceae bacterium]|nr:bifunctional metallophosphatase/5'-nucleotidase [Lachnospiraceae bacterium]
MKKLLTILISFCLVFGMVGTAYAEPAEEDGNSLKKDVVILFTSDVHCGVDQNFSYPGLFEAKKSLEDEGNYVVLVDNGDSIQGEPIGSMTKGEANIELMNTVGYDIATPGNHEFDYGMDQFLSLTKKAKFPYISCNFNKEGTPVFDPYIIKEFDGVKVAFVGITTPKTITSSTPKYFQDENGKFIYDFCQDKTGEKMYNAVQSAVDAARDEGAEYVIAMAHLGNEDSCKPWTYADVVSNTTGINAVLDGHSHDCDQVIMQNKDGEDVPRSACGTKLESVGYCRLGTDGTLTTGLYTYNNEIPASKMFNLDNKVSKQIAKISARLEKSLSEVVAKTSVDLTINDPEAVDNEGHPIRIVRRAETNLADLCADAYRDQMETDVAFINGGNVRVSIPAGDITRGDIMKVHPFSNLMTVVEVTGQQLLDALEWGCHATPSEFGGFLQVSGLTYEIHTYIDSNCVEDENGMFEKVDGEYRVKNVMVDGKPLDLEKKYTVASNSYILTENGDGFTMFSEGDILQDSVKLDNQILIDYITGTLGGVVGEEYSDPYGDGRIIAVEEKDENSKAAAEEKKK